MKNWMIEHTEAYAVVGTHLNNIPSVRAGNIVFPTFKDAHDAWKKTKGIFRDSSAHTISMGSNAALNRMEIKLHIAKFILPHSWIYDTTPAGGGQFITKIHLKSEGSVYATYDSLVQSMGEAVLTEDGKGLTDAGVAALLANSRTPEDDVLSSFLGRHVTVIKTPGSPIEHSFTTPDPDVVEIDYEISLHGVITKFLILEDNQRVIKGNLHETHPVYNTSVTPIIYENGAYWVAYPSGPRPISIKVNMKALREQRKAMRKELRELKGLQSFLRDKED